MHQARFVEDNSLCTTQQYAAEPDKYRGLIICDECKEKAWFVKSHIFGDRERSAYFSAHHKEGCNASTIVLTTDDDEKDQPDNSTYRVDLDKNKGGSILVAESAEKYNEEPSPWKNTKGQQVLGSSGFPTNKSLRQLLTHLCRNAHFADAGQTIKIVADSGRVLLEGELKTLLVHVTEITDEHLESLHIFWGRINNVNETEEELWLNMGDYRKEPSILLDNDLKRNLLHNFKLKDVDDLQGADFILVGHCGKSGHGKFTLRFGMTKYISFRVFGVKTDVQKF